MCVIITISGKFGEAVKKAQPSERYRDGIPTGKSEGQSIRVLFNLYNREKLQMDKQETEDGSSNKKS